MENVLSYHVYRDSGIAKWLADDEHTWTTEFTCSAAFTSWELADDVAKRECGDDTFYVFACMASR